MKSGKRRLKTLAMVLGAFLAVLCAVNANAALIGTFSHSYLGGDVVIDLNVFDGQPGPNPLLWEYTVTNNGFDPMPGTSNGFSGFELFLPSPIPEIMDVTPSASTVPPWEVDCCSGNPVEWDRRNSAGNGIMPGEVGVFSFTTGLRGITINDQGWFHTWEFDVQTDIVPTDAPAMHVPFVPGLPPPIDQHIPEPGTMILLGCGLVGFAAYRRRRT